MLFYFHETWTYICIYPKPIFYIKTISPSVGIPIKKFRWSRDTMIFKMEILILVRQRPYIELALSYITLLISYVLITRAHFLSIAQSKLRLCSANHRSDYWLRVSSDYAQPITGQVTEVTCPVIGRTQSELTPSKRQKMGAGRASDLSFAVISWFLWFSL